MCARGKGFKGASCRWSPDVVAMGTGHSGAVKSDLVLPPSPFSLHCSSFSISDRSHLAWQRVEMQQRVPSSQVWPLHATQQSAWVNKVHADTHVQTSSHIFIWAVTWLLTHLSHGPAVLHYDKYTRVVGSCQPGFSLQILGVHLQPFKAHFAKDFIILTLPRLSSHTRGEKLHLLSHPSPYIMADDISHHLTKHRPLFCLLPTSHCNWSLHLGHLIRHLEHLTPIGFTDAVLFLACRRQFTSP